jgi:hypothetical protein
MWEITTLLEKLQVNSSIERFDRVLTIMAANTILASFRSQGVSYNNIFLLGVSAFALAQYTKAKTPPPMKPLFSTMSHLAMILTTQSFISRSEIDTQKDDPITLLQKLMNLTCVILILCNTLTSFMPDTSKKFVTSIQFVYLDSIKSVLQKLPTNTIAIFCTTLVLTPLQNLKNISTQRKSILQTLTVAVVDLLVVKMLPKQLYCATWDIDATVRACVVVFIDNISKMTLPLNDIFENTRSYVMWQVSQEFNNDIKAVGELSIQIALLAHIIILCAYLTPRLHALSEIGIITSINVLLDNVQGILKRGQDTLVETIVTVVALQLVLVRVVMPIYQHHTLKQQ